jgi:hypothetical protein
MTEPKYQPREHDRMRELADYNIDIAGFENSLGDLAELAAEIAGAEISLINILDATTQWTISRYGLDIAQMRREDSVCQYTILGNEPFEVKDLDKDKRFRDKFYVTGDPHVTYYFGLPLKSGEHSLGALCLLSKQNIELPEDKRLMLRLVAKEVMARLNMLKQINTLQGQLADARVARQKVLHLVRGPVTTMVELAEVIAEPEKLKARGEDAGQLANMIYLSGKTVLNSAEEILALDTLKSSAAASDITLLDVKKKLEKLYQPQANSMQVQLLFKVNPVTSAFRFPPGSIMTVTGHLLGSIIDVGDTGSEVVAALDIVVGKRSFFQLTLELSALKTSDNRGLLSSTQAFIYSLDMAREMLAKVDGELIPSTNAGKAAVVKVRVPLPAE